MAGKSPLTASVEQRAGLERLAASVNRAEADRARAIGFYSALLIVDIYLMVKAVRLGPQDIPPEPRARTVAAASSAE